MPGITCFEDGTLVSGSSGFLGSNLCSVLEKDSTGKFAAADVLDSSVLTALKSRYYPSCVVHLASTGAVLTSLDRIPGMFDATIDGLIHLLNIVQPEQIIFPSSCAVYGHVNEGLASLDLIPNPVSAYGAAKLMGERVIDQWVYESGKTGIVLRIGNLVGCGKKGLIAYLLNHALRYPHGEVPARMRGAGKIVRDYVPVDYAVRVIQAALKHDWRPGNVHALNLGSGIPRSNGEIAAIVQETLKEQGILLNILYQESPAFGEAGRIALDVSETHTIFGFSAPSAEEVTEAIRQSVFAHLEQAARTISV